MKDPKLLPEFVTSFEELERKIEEERYFPKEKFLSPVRLEYKMKKLNFMEKKQNFRTILDNVRYKMATSHQQTQRQQQQDPRCRDFSSPILSINADLSILPSFNV